MSRRSATVDESAVSIPVAVDGMAEGSGEWSEKHNVNEALLRSPEADTHDELVRAVTRIEGDIAAHNTLDRGPDRRALAWALGGVVVGGLLGAAVVAALHARR